jgi:hypothetical protein
MMCCRLGAGVRPGEQVVDVEAGAARFTVDSSNMSAGASTFIKLSVEE